MSFSATTTAAADERPLPSGSGGEAGDDGGAPAGTGSLDVDVDDLSDLLADTVVQKTTLTTWSIPDPALDPDIKLGDCGKCGLAVRGGASLVKGVHFHPDCHTCNDCNQPLGSQQFFIIKGKNYCMKDKNKHLERCKMCNEYIEEKAIRTKGTEDVYHPDCFVCNKCGVVLHGPFFTVDNQTLCEDDFVKSRDKCHRCSRPILEASLKALSRLYHPECFRCSMCPETLDGKEFFVNEDATEPVCKDDYVRFIAKMCDGCKTAIIQERYVSLSTGENFHQRCYTVKQH